MTRQAEGDIAANVGVSEKVRVGACFGALSVDEPRGTNSDVEQGAQVKAKLSRMERVARPSFRLLDKSSREGIFPYFFS